MSGTARGWSALQGVAGWLWITAILGFAGALMAHRAGHSLTRAADSASREPPSRRAARYANQAVLPCYLLHEPVIVAIAWIIVGWHLPILAKYPLLVITSFAGTLFLYEALIRRFGSPGSCSA
jgi:peptidoglycan/LPS O-acetylase OafA/YrhL